MSFHPNLRHLKALVAVAEQGSVSRAADNLYKTQSAVTRSIHELESMLGVELFERNVCGMRITCFGNALLRRSQQALMEFDIALDEMAALNGTPNGPGNSASFSVLLSSRRLQAFVKLGELHHMHAVAHAMGVSQPAISAAIGELEQHLATPLFTRTAKGVLLTDAGAILSFRARRALGELRHVESDMAALKGATGGRVVVGALPLSRSIILPQAICRIIARHPDLRIATVESNFETLAAGLRAGDIDFVLGALRPPESTKDLQSEPLLCNQMAIVARANHPLTRQPAVSVDDLLKEKWIMAGQQTPSRMVFEQAFARISAHLPRTAVETSDLATLRGLLINSNMITAIAAQQLDFEIESGTLAVIDFPLPDTVRTIGIIRRMDDHLSPAANALMNAVRAVSLELATRTGQHT